MAVSAVDCSLRPRGSLVGRRQLAQTGGLQTGSLVGSADDNSPRARRLSGRRGAMATEKLLHSSSGSSGNAAMEFSLKPSHFGKFFVEDIVFTVLSPNSPGYRPGSATARVYASLPAKLFTTGPAAAPVFGLVAVWRF